MHYKILKRVPTSLVKLQEKEKGTNDYELSFTTSLSISDASSNSIIPVIWIMVFKFHAAWLRIDHYDNSTIEDSRIDYRYLVTYSGVQRGVRTVRRPLGHPQWGASKGPVFVKNVGK